MALAVGSFRRSRSDPEDGSTQSFFEQLSFGAHLLSSLPVFFGGKERTLLSLKLPSFR